MKTFFFFIASFIFFSAKSQNSWQIISPHPTGINLTAVSMISETEYWITAQQGRIFHTADAGNTWDIYDSPSPFRTYFGIKMFDQNNGWINAYGDTIFKTNDGGQTWIPVLLPFHLTAWYWKNANEGWISGDPDILFHTVNGGVTWTIETFPGAPVRYIGFSDAIHGWVIADNGEVWKSNDGGSSWNKIVNANTNLTNIRSVSFPDANTGYVTTFNWDHSESVLFKTSNGGVSWSQMIHYPNMIYGGGVVTFFDADRGIMLDNLAGQYSLTFDGGNLWTPYSVGIDGPVNKIDFYNSTFVAIGSPGNIIKSNDLGLSFTSLIDRLNCGKWYVNICFVDTLTGFMESDGLYKTTDGGFTWFILDSNSYSYDNEKVYFINNLVGWRNGGINCTVKRSVDGGVTWTNSTSPQYPSLNDFCFVTTDLGWGVDGHGKIISTVDGGIHWEIDTAVNYPKQFYKIVFSDSLHGWATCGSIYGSLLSVWKTIDGGSTWNVNFEDSTSGMYGPGTSLAATDPDHVWLVEHYRLRKSTDGGISWTTSFITPNNYLILPKLVFADSLNGLCGGQYAGSDILLKTSDGGLTWVPLLQYNAERISSISYVDSSHIWVSGTPAFLAAYRPISTNISSTVIISQLEIFPNPASTKLVLHFKPTSGNYSISLTDITGRIVSQQLLKVIPGEEYYTLDISGLARGVYFVRVSGRQMDGVGRFVKN